MAHQRNASRHLRNRHGSETLSADDLPRRHASFTTDSSPYMQEETLISASEGDWTPAVLENGSAVPDPASANAAAAAVAIAPGGHPPHQPNHHHQHNLKVPLSPPLSLPSGASTPAGLLATDHGHLVASYPPAAPTWMNMPNKGQLAILAGSRFVDFFQMAALQTYMVHQLKSFDHDLPDSVISHQAGVLQGAFTAAQIITSILWGRAADRPTVGRKMVLYIGLVGTGVGCVGVGFSRTYGQAVFWRLLSGAINGTVGSARTMVAECTPKPWHPRAFLLLPAAFNVANVLGPILAGLLVDPVVNFPHLFGEGSTFGGATGVAWMKAYPYAVANLLSTALLFAEAVIVHVGLQETLKGKRPFEFSALDPIAFVRRLVAAVGFFFSRVRSGGAGGYRPVLRETHQREGLLSGQERSPSSFEMDRMNARGEKVDDRLVQRLPFRRIWTSNVLWVLLSIAVFDFHMGAFANLWILFLATPRQYIPGSSTNNPAAAPPAANLEARGVFKFASGLAFPPPTIGFAMAIIGFIGVALQFLLYPWANARYGLMRSFRAALPLFPLAYYLAPYIALLPSATPPPGAASGWTVWIGISAVLLLQVAARTFALPATIILLNNSSPHPSVLATVHGVGQACSATFRTLGPMLAGYWYGVWTERGVVGMAWWIVAAVAGIGCAASFWVRNGSGHEIFLPGEEEAEKEAGAGGGSGDGR